MENKLTPEVALQNLYVAARQAKLSADEHAIIGQSAQVLSEAIKSEEVKTEIPA